VLYTTYLANAKKIPPGVKKYLVVRFLPKDFGYNGEGDIIHVPALSPSVTLLLEYKKNKDWDFYVRRFEQEMENRADLKEALKNLYDELKKGQDICLICYEKDFMRCHRFLIAKKLVEKGIEWKEF